MNANRQCTQEEVEALVSATDTSGDGKINKQELYVIFEKVASQWFEIMKSLFKILFLKLPIRLPHSSKLYLALYQCPHIFLPSIDPGTIS